MKVCIYLRKSRADRDHPEIPLEDVLKNHEAILLTFAEKNNLKICDIKKEVVSGESLARRPEMLKLLEEVEDGLYDAVLVKDFDRLGRGNMMEQGLIIETFRKSGVKIITPDKTYDLGNDLDEEYIDLSAFFARKELKMITKRLHSGRMKSLSDGNYISPHAPFGYDKDKKALIINEREQSVVRLIFELCANHGYGAAKIANYLTEHGIPNKHGGGSWDKTTIRNILRNPVYIGKVTWNKRAYRYQENGKRSSRFLNQSNWRIYEGRHEALIEVELFEKAQQPSSCCRNPHLPAAKSLRNPMADLIKCNSCGAAMTIRTAAGRADTLRCYKNCGGSMSSYLSSVEERLISILALRLSEFALPIQYMEEEKKTASEYSVLIRSLKSLQNKKEKLNQQRNNLHDLLEQGVYDRDTFLERSKILAEGLRLSEIRSEAIRIQLSNYTSELCSPTCSIESNLGDFLRDFYWKLDPKNKNDILKDLIGSVRYSKPKGSEKNDFSLEINLRI